MDADGNVHCCLHDLHLPNRFINNEVLSQYTLNRLQKSICYYCSLISNSVLYVTDNLRMNIW